MMAGVFEMIIGFSGILGLLLKYIGPLVIASTISLVGMSLFRSVGTFAAPQWGIAILLVLLINQLTLQTRCLHIFRFIAH